MVEGYLAHKWDLKDDLAEAGFSVRNGLVLYYPFNETDGSVTEDYTTDLRHGLVIDADLSEPGKFSSGIGFDEIDSFNAKIDLGYNELNLLSPNWTISTWVRTPVYHEDIVGTLKDIICLMPASFLDLNFQILTNLY